MRGERTVVCAFRESWVSFSGVRAQRLPVPLRRGRAPRAGGQLPQRGGPLQGLAGAVVGGAHQPQVHWGLTPLPLARFPPPRKCLELGENFLTEKLAIAP